VDHGTAFDRAGKNRANAESMIDAIYMAITIAKNMKNVHELHELTRIFA
jgi:4-hydroxythreonine-4-phosphate dehydrogenase